MRALEPNRDDPRGTNRFIHGVTTSVAGFVDSFDAGPFDTPVRVSSLLDFERTFGGLSATSAASFGILQFFRNGGQIAWVVRSPEGASGPTLLKSLRSYGQIDREMINVLCLPGVVGLPAEEALETLAGALGYCAEKKVFLIIDIPEKIDRGEKMGKWAARLKMAGSDHAAVYFPRLLIEDPLSPGERRNIAASGTLAGIYARTDQSRGVWSAPAGIDAVLMGADPAVEVGDRWIERFKAEGVNVLRPLSARGLVSWGARTLAPAGEWRYVNVRRLADYIEASLEGGLGWVGGERNGEGLWSEVRRETAAFLDGLYRTGAFQGASPEDAYFARCDRTTISDEDLERGAVNVLVGFAPVHPAEFVFLRIELMTRTAGKGQP